MEEGLDERSQRLLWIFVPLGTVASLIILVGSFLMMRPKEVVAAPTGFTPYVASDRSFKCEAPQGWETVSVESHGVMGGALFKRGSAKIDITADLAGSLMGDIAIASDRQAQGMEEMLQGMQGAQGMPVMAPAAPRKPPVEKLHEADRKAMEKQYPGYEEQPMQVLKAPAGMGDGRFSEFTVKGTLMAPAQHGYRVTILPTERRLTVLCICPEKNWPMLEPAFERVITSLAPGGG